MNESESLDSLANEAASVDVDVVQGRAEVAQAAQVTASNAAELLSAAVMVRALWLPLLPPYKAAPLSRVWSDDVLQNAANAGAGVLDLHGIQFGDVLGRYAPYIALVAALGPPVLATAQIMRTPEPKPANAVKGEGAADGAGQQQ